MKVFIINSSVVGSTGKIVFGISDKLIQCGNSVVCAAPIQSSNRDIKIDHSYVAIGSYWSRVCNVFLSRFTGFQNCFSVFSTKKLIKAIDEFNPDIINLHNLHGDYINLPLLFRYIKKTNKKVVLTLHDCWAFTGHCPHFTLESCNKWIDGCYKCPRYKEYPKTYFDSSKKMYKLKKGWFIGVKNLTIVTPSEWLAALVKQSFLKDYPVKVINNGIDLNVFKPTESDFRKKYNISDNKYILLGVAFGWGKRKGLDVFIELQKRLDKDKYQIVLVGTDDNVDKQLPSSIISIHRTQNQTELAEIYTAADLFVNPTREENYPTVNMESIACGTPVITFRTGGSPEILTEKTGMVVDCDDIDALQNGIENICNNKLFSKIDCVEYKKNFDINQRLQEYVNIMNSMCATENS